jgi:hypothetical protein
VTPKFDVPEGPHAWMGKHVFVGVAEKIPGGNRFHYFVVRWRAAPRAGAAPGDQLMPAFSRRYSRGVTLYLARNTRPKWVGLLNP